MIASHVLEGMWMTVIVRYDCCYRLYCVKYTHLDIKKRMVYDDRKCIQASPPLSFTLSLTIYPLVRALCVCEHPATYFSVRFIYYVPKLESIP